MFEPPMLVIPGRASDSGPDTSEDPPTVESLIEEAREALSNVESALKEPFMTKRRQLCLEAIREADEAVDAAWNKILEEF